jgi:hypothetical protein
MGGVAYRVVHRTILADTTVPERFEQHFETASDQFLNTLYAAAEQGRNRTI